MWQNWTCNKIILISTKAQHHSQLALGKDYEQSDYASWQLDHYTSYHIIFNLQNVFIHANYGGNKDIINGDSNKIFHSH